MKVAAIGLLVLLSACASFPRGAGLQREVLSNQTKSEAGSALATQEFAVEPVVRGRLALYDGWPAVGDKGLGWPGKGGGSSTRSVHAGDMVSIHIWVSEDNSLLTSPGQRQVQLPPMQVDPRGNIFLPYIGQAQIGGMTVGAAREKVQEAYAAVSPSAQVQMELQEGRGSSASLVSGVAQPGTFPLPGQDISMLELIAQGGGAAPGLNNPQIRLLRGDTLYGISMERLLANPALNTTVRGGDRIHIEADKRYFLALGAAAREAPVYFPQDWVTALDALSLIGGLSDGRADARGILILRSYPAKHLRQDGTGPTNTRTIFTIDLTTADGLFSAGEFRIMPGDLVYVTESPLGSANILIGLIASAFGVANSASAVAERTN